MQHRNPSQEAVAYIYICSVGLLGKTNFREKVCRVQDIIVINQITHMTITTIRNV